VDPYHAMCVGAISDSMTEKIEHVLIVEDEIFVALEMKAALMDIGVKSVEICGQLRDAVDCAYKSEIDFALVDVNLGPNQTSETLVQVLRNREVPFAFITAYDPDQIAFRKQDDRVFRKPVSRNCLDEVFH
jgi:two-component SAPR family response regulator